MTDIEEADVAVVGSGMGGLAAARTIAQFGGRRVLVLEQHYTLGGMTHEFTRAGHYRFGTGLHYMSANAGPFLEFMTDGRTPWQGYLRVVAVESLTSSVRRIRLEPLDGGDLPFTFTAGQYVKLELPVAAEPVVRSYSICSGPDRTAFLEIAVRREPDGLGSVFLHDEVDTGQALRVTGPHGGFTWTGGSEAETLLLISGGVGITPLMSVLAAAADAGHAGRIVLLASFRAEDEVLFGAELAALRHRLPGLVVKFVVTEWYGRIGVEELRPYVDGNTRVHLCGPAPMMQDLIGHLTGLRVPREAIHTEAFVSGSSGRTRRERAHALACQTLPTGDMTISAGTDHLTTTESEASR